MCCGPDDAELVAMSPWLWPQETLGLGTRVARAVGWKVMLAMWSQSAAEGYF